ncbi:hypothetical protein K523DRAFT_321461 [Schizophyllum commune Tattone D]|nr:hypothetical protein K523DRAFT_321461 [Schizophyllum commune Tattone D]
MASDGASATYPNGASDSDAWARVPQIGIHPERVSRGGRGKGLAARGVRRGQRPLAIGTPPLAGRGLSMPVLSGTRGPPERGAPPERHGHHRLSTTDSVIHEYAPVYHRRHPSLAGRRRGQAAAPRARFGPRALRMGEGPRWG